MQGMGRCIDECGGCSSCGGFAVFDECVLDLECNGYALISLPELLQQHHDGSDLSIARAFDTARRSLDGVACNRARVPLINPSSDSGSWTGYHHAAVVNGRYNQFREGFVFSNGEMFDGEDGCFRDEMSKLFRFMHDRVANGILGAIERRLELAPLYFHREIGPTGVSSQWHMKRYRCPERSRRGCDIVGAAHRDLVADVSNEGSPTHRSNQAAPSQSEKDADIFLPSHTDPSLVSVVILDRAGSNAGGLGLQTQSNEDGTWREIRRHGHDVAVVFVGSVLSYLTKGRIFAAVKHRVVDWGVENADEARMAATLFVRPSADALMRPLPSPLLECCCVGKKKDPPTFRVWNARVAKNYMKKKKRMHSKDTDE